MAEFLRVLPKRNNKSSKSLKSIPDKDDIESLKVQLTINIFILGDSKSGKSNLVNSYLNQSYDSNENKEDIFKIQSKKLLINNNLFEVCFYEFSGNLSRDSEALSEYLNLADVYIICHSFDQAFKENNLKKWLNLCRKSKPKYMIGTKYDIKLIENLQINNDINCKSKKEKKNPDNNNSNIIGMSYMKNKKIDDKKSDESSANISNNDIDNQVKEENDKDSKNSKNSEDEYLSFEDHVKNFITSNYIIKYFYTSALMNFGVTEAFDFIFKKVIIDYVSMQKQNQIQVEEKYKCCIF